MKRYEVKSGKSGVTYWKCQTLEDAKKVLAEHGAPGDYVTYRGERVSVKKPVPE